MCERLDFCKVGVLVESGFIPEELEAYRSRFEALGAEVHFLSDLWGQPSLTFVSNVDTPEKDLATTRGRLRYFSADRDIRAADLTSYSAIIMSAGYASVRLRFFRPPDGRIVGPELVGSAPAVRFFARAMEDRRIVKGALCHGLWILTPRPDLLRGRRVICHEVVLADVRNAGALYEHSAEGVVVDDDLVTGRSAADVPAFIDAIAGRITANRAGSDRALSLSPR